MRWLDLRSGRVQQKEAVIRVHVRVRIALQLVLCGVGGILVGWNAPESAHFGGVAFAQAVPSAKRVQRQVVAPQGGSAEAASGPTRATDVEEDAGVQADAGAALDAGVADESLTVGPRRVLRAAVVGSAPFLVQKADGKTFSGFSIDVLRRLAGEAEMRFQMHPYRTVAGALAVVESGQADLAVGPISVTADRAVRTQFLQPYFSAQVGIITRSDSRFFDRLAPFVSNAFLIAVVSLSLVLALVGVLLWLVERRRNPTHFPMNPVRGIANGMWFALVTMTTVGYGDRVPVTLAGRLLSAVWMVVAMLTASSLTAGIATALTLSQLDQGQISGVEDLTDRRVAVVGDTPSAVIARRSGARVIQVASKEEGLALLQQEVEGDDPTARTIDAFLYDLPVLEHYLQEHAALPLALVRTEVRVDDYAFAVAHGSSLERDLNVALLTLRERGELTEIASRWLNSP